MVYEYAESIWDNTHYGEFLNSFSPDKRKQEKT